MNFGVKFNLGLNKINFGVVKNKVHLKILNQMISV
jgi:hypothetical protein